MSKLNDPHAESNSGRTHTSSLMAHQMFQHHLIQRGIVAIGDKIAGLFFVKTARFLEESQESSAAVIQVREPMLDFGRAEGVNIETYIFSLFSVAVAFEGPHLVESDAQIGAAEGLVLVEFQAVLVIQME